MTPIEGALLLTGIFGVPVVLLVKTQRFRSLGTRMRGAFWGGIVGYGVGLVVWGAATIAPAVMWDAGSARLAGVVLPLVAFGGLGIGIGAVIGKRPKTREERRRRASGSPED